MVAVALVAVGVVVVVAEGGKSNCEVKSIVAWLSYDQGNVSIWKSMMRVFVFVSPLPSSSFSLSFILLLIGSRRGMGKEKEEGKQIRSEIIPP